MTQIFLFEISANHIHSSVNPLHPNLPHPEVPQGTPTPISRGSRESRINNTYLPHSNSSSHTASLENGLPPDPTPPTGTSLSQYQHRGSLVAPQPSPAIR